MLTGLVNINVLVCKLVYEGFVGHDGNGLKGCPIHCPVTHGSEAGRWTAQEPAQDCASAIFEIENSINPI